MIRNLTNETKIFDELPLVFNLDFTMPQSQFPITILPNDSADVLICFYPLKPAYGHYYDTIFFKQPCFKQYIVLTGELLHSKYYSGSKCDVEILARTDTVGKSLPALAPVIISAVYANGEIHFKTNMIIHSGQVQVFDILGQEIMSAPIPKNTTDLILQCPNLTNGIYFLLLSNQVGKSVSKISILK
jgi:hypothetical protein